MTKFKSFLLIAVTAICVIFISSCKKTTEDDTTTTTPAVTTCAPATSFTSTGTGPHLIFKFKFDSTQARLNNIGIPAGVPAGHGAQSPQFNFISQHYIELAGDFDSLGHGQVLYVGQTTTAGGAAAIDYCASTATADNVAFFSKPLSAMTPGTYKWLRISLAYQCYNILYKSSLIPTLDHMGSGTVASFLGYDTYISGYQINGHSYQPSSGAGGVGDHLQGYWGFETSLLGTTYFTDGQSAGTTTVPNPNHTNSPIPAGSCVVTGQFVNSSLALSPLVITGTETSDIVITVSLSTNKSFEWIDTVADGLYQPEVGDVVVDMGVRGLIPIIN